MTNPETLQKDTYAIHEATTHLGGDGWVREEPHLAPERVGNKATALVDGKETMAAIAADLKRAEQYIYITGWALAPTVRLIRNGPLATLNHRGRKGESLEKIAHKYHTSVAEIRRLNPDIRLRTEARISTPPLFVAAQADASAMKPDEQLAVDQRLTVPADTHTLIHLLWQRADEGVQVRIILWDSTLAGQLTNDMSAEVILQNAHKNIRVFRDIPKILTTDSLTRHQKSVVVDGKVAHLGGIDLWAGRWDEATHPVVADPNLHEGDDFYNPGLLHRGDPRFCKKLDHRRHPRMPWHDVHLRIEGPCVYDVEKSFVQRWNYQAAAPELGKSLTRVLATGLTESLLKLNEENALASKEKSDHTQKIQIVRSVSGNHVLTSQTERSIYNAYANAIRGAQYFIYIENQYFTSGHDNGDVKNLIMELLAERVARAMEDREPFKIVLVIPAHPDGSLFDWKTSEVMHHQFRTLGRRPGDREGSSGRGEGEALEQKPTGLVNRIVDALVEKMDKDEDEAWTLLQDYVGIYCLRNHGVLKNTPVHEQIYVHTKLMIVDDRIAIIGSANINDRCLLGDNDSELAAIVEDQEIISSMINGEECYVRKFAHELRRRLWAEHLGVSESDQGIGDPFNGFERLKDTARKNTALYEAAFRDVPSDRIGSLDDLKLVLGEYDKGHVEDLRNNVKGHILEFPLGWLSGGSLHRD